MKWFDRPPSPSRQALLIVLAFVGFSLLWIPTTDQLLGWMVQDPILMTRLATYKGMAYIGIAALLLYALVTTTSRGTITLTPHRSASLSKHEGFGPTAILFGLAILVVSLTAFGIYRQQQTLLEKKALEELSFLAESQKNHMELWLRERLMDAEVTAQDPLLNRSLLALKEHPGRVPDDLMQRLQSLKSGYGYQGLCVVDPDGRLLASTNRHAITGVEQSVAKTLRAQDPARLVWSLEATPTGARAHVSCMMPVRDGTGPRPHSILVFHLDVESLLTMILREQPHYRTTNETLLACRQGDMLVFLNRAQLSTTPIAGVSMARTDRVGVQAVLKGDGTYSGLDYRDVPSLAASRRLASLPWVLFTKMDKAEIVAPLARLAWIVASMGILVLGVLGFLLMVRWNRSRALVQLNEDKLQLEKDLLDQRLQSLSRYANDIVLLLDEEGRILDANDRALHAYGYTSEEMRRLNIKDLRTLDASGDFTGQFHEVQAQRSIRFETVHVRKNGSFFPVEISSRGFEMEGTAYVQSILRDISERKEAEARLSQSEQRYRGLFEEATEGLALVETEGWTIASCNRAFEQLSGYDRADLLGAPFTRVHPEALAEGLRDAFRTFLAAGRPLTDLATRLRLPSGKERDVQIKVELVRVQGQSFIQGMFTDLTEIRRREREREATVNLLRLLNEPRNHTHELIALLTDYLQKWTGCEAVGIRLRDGDDFPYFETRGFPAEFVEKENLLCARDLTGQLLRDGDGNPVLECMCGNILCGRFDPGLPFFTEHGSFWTNGTTELLASTSEQDRQARTRNRCNGEGYESVALIPLRTGSETLGLLQLNDHSQGRFTPELIHFLEQAGAQIALALAQHRMQETLRRNEARHRQILETTQDGFWVVDPKARIQEVNEAYCRMVGYTREELLAMCITDLDAIQDPEVVGAHMDHLIQNHWNFFESRHRHKRGQLIDVEVSAVFLPEQGGSFAAFIRDITERKQLEVSLRESEQAYRSLFETMAVGAFRQLQDGTLIDVNPEALRIFGLRKEQFLARTSQSEAWDVLREDGTPCPAEEHPSMRALRTGLPVLGEMLGILQEGSLERVWVEVYALPEYLTGETSPHQVLVTLHDITPRKRAEDAVRRSEQRFRTVADHTYDWEYWHDANGRFIYSSPSCERVTGYRPEEFQDLQAFTSIVLEEDLSRFQEHARHAPEGPFKDELQFRIHHRDGRVRWLGHLCRPILEDGHFLGIRGSNRDITEQKLAQEWLRESELRLRRIIEATRVGTWEWNIQTGEVVFNERWAEIIGYHLRDLAPLSIQTWTDRAHPEDLKQSEELLRRHFTHELPSYDIECRMRHRDGHWVWVHDRGQVTEWADDGRPLSMSGTHTDITERKAADAALLHEQQFSTSILESLPGIFYLYTYPELRLVSWNKQHETLLGFEAHEMEGRHLWDWHIPEAKEAVLRAVDLVMEQGQNKVEASLVAKDGRQIPFLLTGTRFEADGQPYLMGIGLDITEQREAEAILRDDFERLQSMLRVFQCEIEDRQAFLDLALEESIRMTGSRLGYIYFYSEERQQFVLHAWSKDAMAECTVTNPETCYDLANTGVWGETVRQRKPIVLNDYLAEHPLKKGYPEGHVQLKKFLTVPIFREGRIVAVVGVANKDTDYTEKDILQLRLLVDGVWRSMALFESLATLRVSEQRYARLFASIQEGFSLHEILTDDNGKPIDYRFLEVNPAFETMTGVPRDHWVGHTMREILPGIEERWIEVYGRVALTGESVQFEDHAAALGRWFQVHAFSPKAGQFAVLSFDITDRKKAEIAVQDQLRFLNSLLDNIPLPIYSKDAEGRYATVNGTFAAMLGRSKEELYGKSVFEVADEAHARLYYEQDRQLLAAPGIQSYEAGVKAADGSLRDMVFHKATFDNAQGDVAGIVGIMIDVTERKQMESALRQSERFLREAQEVGRAGCYLLDFPKGTWESTETLDEIFGIDRNYPRTVEGWLQLVAPIDQERMAAYFQNLVATGSRFDQDYRIRRVSDNQERWVMGLGELGYSDHGELLTMIGTIQDITERKRAEEALQDVNQRLNLAVASGRIGIWDLDLTTSRIGWNDEMFHLYGYDKAITEPTLALWARSLHPEDAQATQEAYLAALRGDREYDPEFRVVHPDGSVRHIKGNAIVIRDPNGSAIRMIGLNRDITNQKLTETALQKHLLALTSPMGGAGTVQFEELFDLGEIQEIQDRFAAATGVASIITDPKGHPITRPSNFCHLCEGVIRSTELGLKNCIHSDAVLGRMHSEGPIIQPCLSGGLWDAGASISVGDQHLANWLIGQVLDDSQDESVILAYGDRIGADPEAFREALRGVTRMSRERFEKISQSLFIIARQISNLAAQNVQQARFIVRRQEAEAALAKLNEELEARIQDRTAQLEAANRELEAFSYSVSHDLRAPLRGIDGFSQALLEDYHDKLDEEGRHYLKRVRHGAQRMGQLIEDLLRLSRVSRAELVRQRVDLSDLAHRILRDLAEAHPERKVQVAVASGLSLEGDPRLLAIVMENLLANAWKFSALRLEAFIEVGQAEVDGETVFWVRDNGAGFDMAYASKLFNAFQRLHSSEQFEGTGIGLAIVHRIIRRHGGRIWAESTLGGGATFRFTLPGSLEEGAESLGNS